MKNIFTLSILFLFVQLAKAQQPAQYSLYMFNKFAFNPGYAGLDNSVSMNGVYRKQWVGLDGAPVSQNFNVHTPLYFAGGGVGLALDNESIGSWKQTSVMLAYNYQMQTGKAGILSMGISAGMVQRQLDGSEVRTPSTILDDEGNPQDHQDLILSILNEKGGAPTVHAGVFYQGKNLEAGISAVNLLENELSFSTLTFKQERAYYLYLGYRLEVGQSITLHPSFLLKSDVRQTQMDFSLMARYNENIFAGGSFRGYSSESIDALVLFAGLKLSDKITVGYAYDLTLSNLKIATSGSHEIMLNYNLGRPIGKGRPPAIIYNPRSL